MDIQSIFILALVCASGAISPGPSLAVVIRNTMRGGQLQGVMTGVGHGLGLTIYAFIAVMGLSSTFLANPSVFKMVQISGALFLLWISYNMIRPSISDFSDNHKDSGRKGFVEGFMISFLNPKILAFFVAIFSQFIHDELTRFDRIIIATIAGVIDTTWYVLVAILLAGTKLIDKIRKNAELVDRSIGIFLMLVAAFIIIQNFNSDF